MVTLQGPFTNSRVNTSKISSLSFSWRPLPFGAQVFGNTVREACHFRVASLVKHETRELDLTQRRFRRVTRTFWRDTHSHTPKMALHVFKSVRTSSKSRHSVLFLALFSTPKAKFIGGDVLVFQIRVSSGFFLSATSNVIPS